MQSGLFCILKYSKQRLMSLFQAILSWVSFLPILFQVLPWGSVVKWHHITNNIITSSSRQAGFGQPQNGQWPRKQLADMHSFTFPELNWTFLCKPQLSYLHACMHSWPCKHKSPHVMVYKFYNFSLIHPIILYYTSSWPIRCSYSCTVISS